LGFLICFPFLSLCFFLVPLRHTCLPTFPYTTLFRSKARLIHDFPKYREILNKPEQTHAEVFTNIYKNNVWENGSGGGSYEKNTVDYRAFLQQFMKDNNIKTVVDLGCGDWQMNKLMDWSGINYLGVDCVHFLMNENVQRFGKEGIAFETADITSFDVPTCDLLLIKDVFIHWTNAEIIRFFKKQIPAKYILVTNDNRVNGEHKDNAAPGQYRDVDITQPPFNIAAEPVFIWNNGIYKTTHLIKN